MANNNVAVAEIPTLTRLTDCSWISPQPYQVYGEILEQSVYSDMGYPIAQQHSWRGRNSETDDSRISTHTIRSMAKP